MSAYVVENDTINKILRFLDFEGKSTIPHCLGQIMLRYVGLGDKSGNISREQLQALGEEMVALNVKAVDCRYNEDNPIPAFVYNRGRIPRPVECLKALQCWHYQCCEEGADDDELYLLMETVKHALAVDIVVSLPEYEKLPWG